MTANADTQAAPTGATPRTGKELIRASREYAKDDPKRSWWAVISTLGVCAFFETLILQSIHPAVTVISIIGLGLTMVRAFILFHDYMHLAILRKSKLGKFVFHMIGYALLTPATVWKRTHNYHHANNSKIAGSHIGSYPILSTTMWRRAKKMQRLQYRLSRHPLNIVLGYFTVFLIGLVLLPFFRRPKAHYDSIFALIVHFGWLAAVWILASPMMAVLAVMLPMAIATATGAYLFYAQHNFPDMHVQSRDGWDFAVAATECSSYMKMSPIMHWFTGNIGYHHVHHLNPLIPFYRLPDAMEGIEELQNPGTTSLLPKDIWACLRLSVWDPRKKKMVSFGGE